MRIVFFAATLLASATFGLPVNAQEKMTSWEAAQALGYALTGEEYCGLVYDPQNIEAWIENSVAPDDMEFADNLSTGLYMAKQSQKKLSASGKIAHCAQVRRVAKFYKFIE